MQFIGKTFIIFGIALIIIGIAFYKIPIGKLGMVLLFIFQSQQLF
jgi:hypothetical protein